MRHILPSGSPTPTTLKHRVLLLHTSSRARSPTPTTPKHHLQLLCTSERPPAASAWQQVAASITKSPSITKGQLMAVKYLTMSPMLQSTLLHLLTMGLATLSQMKIPILVSCLL